MKTIGVVFFLTGVIIMIYGTNNPNICGSGNCINPLFYLIFGAITLIGVILFLLNELYDKEGKKALTSQKEQGAKA